ncbi:MAG: universal stress protein [Myxococcales bacterium]|nr:universal stress protein [Myxococcota bacterium]MDW8282041.1 universal stress protein [Myxococcales bacterium]
MEPSLHRVLVATDLSRQATRALHRALHLPLAPAASVCLVHVLPDVDGGRPDEDVEAEARRRLEELLAQARAEVQAAGGRVPELSAKLAVGRVFEQIIRTAQAISADLIVLGARGRAPFHQHLLGTTAERVARVGDVPLLVVRRPFRRSYRRILAAIDGSDASQAVLQLALRVGGADLPLLRVLHAYQVPFAGFVSLGATAEARRRLLGQLRAQAEEVVAACLEQMEGLQVRCKAIVRRGEPRAVLLAEVDRQRADLLVVGTHGRTGLAHFLLGSVAEAAMRCAPCDVLVARSASGGSVLT